MTFKDLGLNAPILTALADQGYEKPSPIQEQAIPPALAGRDVLGCAQTGTGKTCAFATPILQRLAAAPTRDRVIRALILTPTRELALQIQESFEAYGKNLPLRSAVIFGGVGQAPQVDKLRRGVDILVATPGRLGDLYNQKLLDLSHIEIFVLDEADRMLDMGFIHDVRKILKWLPDHKQTLFFSATMPPEITELVNSLLHNPARVAVDPVSSPVEIIDQRLYLVDRGNKSKLLASLLRTAEVKNALVFTRTKHGANKVVTDLEKAGLTAAAIHGNKSQTARQQALADFKAGRIQALVATDIAARGLDIEELSHVVNYNLPEVPETYVHRIGRTGRAGKEGVAISFCEYGEKPCLKDIERLLGRPIPLVEHHNWPMQVFEAVVKDSKGRAVNADDLEARAAAKEKRRAKDAADKAAAEMRKQKDTERTVTPARVVKSRTGGEGTLDTRDQAAVRKRGRGHRASSTLEEAMNATAPAAKTRTVPVQSDFSRPDPLANDIIMDATARLLAPRPRTAQPKAESTRQEPSRRGTPPNPVSRPEAVMPPESAQKFAAKKAAGAPIPEKKSGGRSRNQGRRNGPPEIRRGSQKDSTEQPSLMKPYYLNHDD